MKDRQTETFVRKPLWLRRGLPAAPAHDRLRSFLDDGRLHTVCREARCPNCEECFARGTATFLILGNTCTRRCRFCAVNQGKPSPPDPDEPRRVAEAAVRMSLDYVVVTSVTRDDLADGGAGAFAETIRALRVRRPGIRIEVLIPDFQGDETALRTVLDARPDVLNHNLETVKRLYPEVRPEAVYDRSLELLSRVGRRAPGCGRQIRVDARPGRAPGRAGSGLEGPARRRLQDPHPRTVPPAPERVSAGGPLCPPRGVRRLAQDRPRYGFPQSGRRPPGAKLLPCRSA